MYCQLFCYWCRQAKWLPLKSFVPKQARKPRSYASPKLCPLTYLLTHLLTGVKCRATSVAKKSFCYFVTAFIIIIVRNWHQFKHTSRHLARPRPALSTEVTKVTKNMESSSVIKLLYGFVKLVITKRTVVARADGTASVKTSFSIKFLSKCRFCLIPSLGCVHKRWMVLAAMSCG